MTTIILRGFLKEQAFGEGEALYLSDNERPLVERLEEIKNKQVSIRWFASKEEKTFWQVEEALTKVIMGEAEEVRLNSSFGSEYTGYLWTNEDLVIGGHDFIEELRSFEGQFINMEVIVHE